METFWATVGHLKDIAAIVTPIIIALLGVYINNIIQNQNKIVERRSALTKQWADEFSKLVAEIYDTTLRLLLLYFQAAHHDTYVVKNIENFYSEMDVEIRRIALHLEEQKIRLDKYIDLAPNTGSKLNYSFEQIHSMIREWLKNKGGNADQFRHLQIEFNRQARETHREILELEN